MTYRFLRASALAGVTLALAAPGVASAHGRFGHHVPRAEVRCAAIAAGRTPARLTSDQAAALKPACDSYAAAVAAAQDAYTSATQPAEDAYTAAATSLRLQQRTAEQALRTACAPDRHAQPCKDARTALRTSLKTLRQQSRQAWQTYRAAVRPAQQTRDTAVRAAREAFASQAAQILGRS